MQVSERTSLLNAHYESNRTNGLSLFFAVVCIVDVFGVFPIITLPKAIINCGFYGILIIVVVCSTQIYTAALLGKCWIIAEEMYPVMGSRSRYPYSALAEITYGKYLSNCVTFLLDLTVFGGGIPNLIVASQTLELLSLRVSENSMDISYCYWIIILGTTLCPILWLGSPKDMKCVCTLSVFIVASVFVLVIGCLLFDAGFNSSTTYQNSNDFAMEDVPLWTSLLTAYGIIAFQFDIHPSILTIQIDMTDKLKLPNAITGAFLASICMSGVTTILFSIRYGMSTQSSILETLPTTIPLDVTAGLTALQLCLTSVVSNNALYQHMEDCLSISRDFNPKRCVLRTILMLLAIVIAQSVPRFDLVMSTIGGTLTGPLVFILPPLLYLRILSLRTEHEERLTMQSFNNIVFNKDVDSKNLSRFRESKFKEDFTISLTLVENYTRRIFRKYLEKLLCLLIIIFSTIATIFTTYLNFSNAILSYSNYTKPCIYNISADLLYL